MAKVKFNLIVQRHLIAVSDRYNPLKSAASENIETSL